MKDVNSVGSVQQTVGSKSILCIAALVLSNGPGIQVPLHGSIGDLDPRGH